MGATRRGAARPLTKRQSAILEMVARGLSNKQIAHELAISEQAVKDHVSTLMRRLEAPNRAALGDVAATRRIIGPFDIDPEWLGFLFQHAPMHIAVVSGPEHRFVAVNEAFRVASGERDIVGLTHREAFPERASSLAILDELYRSGKPFAAADLPRRFRRSADGDDVDGYITVVLQPLPSLDGSTGGIAIFSIDTTDAALARQRLEELERRP